MVNSSTLEVGVRDLRHDLSAYLRRAAAGESIRVTSHGKVIAQLGPPVPEAGPVRRRGLLKGKIWMADDFDEWPQDILDSFEAEL